jgi:[ribosomal protein S18]-alanine N-acetyltransferase|tara:strand:+ start:340 stop:792 length:453 start_codon:yes stop_codon:yes gene_type:complete
MISENFLVFNVVKSDLPEILQIENECHYSPWSKNNFVDAINAKNLFTVIKSNNIVVGYSVALVTLDECQLLNIAVKSDHQKIGLGSMMLEILINYCKENSLINIFLEVRYSNTSAISLYNKFGFNELGVRNNYYKKRNGREDGILMGYTI